MPNSPGAVKVGLGFEGLGGTEFPGGRRLRPYFPPIQQPKPRAKGKLRRAGELIDQKGFAPTFAGGERAGQGGNWVCRRWFKGGRKAQFPFGRGPVDLLDVRRGGPNFRDKPGRFRGPANWAGPPSPPGEIARGTKARKEQNRR